MANPVALKDQTAGNAVLMGGGVQMLTIMPQNIGEVSTLADRMAASRFVPPHLRDKPGDCFAVVMQSLRWGMDPYAVSSKTYFVNDRMAYEAQLVNAVVYARAPLKGRLKVEWTGQWPHRHCKVTGNIIGDDDPKIREVHAANIKTRNSPLWVSDPDQQLAYYTTRAWARLYCPDILMGVYTPDDEDMRAERATDITPQGEKSEGGKLDAFERTIAGEPQDVPLPTDSALGLPMVWPAPTADRKSWIDAAAFAAKEIDALATAAACDNWMELNADGINGLMEHHNDVYTRLYARWQDKREGA